MKLNNLLGLLALSLLCFQPSAISAQAILLPAAEETPSRLDAPPVTLEFSAISLSDPSMSGDEPFSISLRVKNPSKEEVKQSVKLMLKDESVEKGKRRQSGAFLTLPPQTSEMITFTFRAKDLLKKGDEMPDNFIFYLGEFEIGVPVDSK